jgi:hypothetical protein
MIDYLESVKKQFAYYKTLGEKTIEQVPEEKLFWQPNEESSSIAMLVKHLWGNMMSRWTDFMTSDGEKEWRERDAEFENTIQTKEEMLEKWNEGWECLFNAINPLTVKDLEREVYIRNMGNSISEAINRQLAHYPYHIGQIVYLGKMIKDKAWTSLSIPKGKSKEYNKEKFSKPKRNIHFTDDL